MIKNVEVVGRLSVNSRQQMAIFNARSANANVVLNYQATLINWGNGSTTSVGDATAGFYNGSTAELVDTVSLNGVSLPIDTNGLFPYSDLNARVSNPNMIDWAVAGYEGLRFIDTASVPNAISILSPHPWDTVSASGFTVTYSGANGGDLSASIQFDDAYNFARGDTAAANTGDGHFEDTVVDNGRVTFSEANLSNITRAFVRLRLSHWEFHIDTLSNGKTVVARSHYDEEMPLYLKQ